MEVVSRALWEETVGAAEVVHRLGRFRQEAPELRHKALREETDLTGAECVLRRLEAAEVGQVGQARTWVEVVRAIQATFRVTLQLMPPEEGEALMLNQLLRAEVQEQERADQIHTKTDVQQRQIPDREAAAPITWVQAERAVQGSLSSSM